MSTTKDGVIVTGLGGMVGWCVAHKLKAAGRNVLGVDVQPPKPEPDVPYVLMDVNDGAALAIEAERHGIGKIVHCGAISGPMVANDNPARVFEINVRGVQTVMETARRLGIARMVWISSIAAYGTQPPGEVDESSPLLSADPYGSSKAAGEALARAYRHTFGLDIVALRVGASLRSAPHDRLHHPSDPGGSRARRAAASAVRQRRLPPVHPCRRCRRCDHRGARHPEAAARRLQCDVRRLAHDR